MQVKWALQSIALVVSSIASTATALGGVAKSYPGDFSYPSSFQWAAFNTQLGGKLIVGKPPQSVCYVPTYDGAACSTIARDLTNATFVGNTPTGIDAPWWSGFTCPILTFMGVPGTCLQGKFPVYVVRAESETDVAAAVKFAVQYNLRLVIKNTGHDFLGRNVGYGSLSIWTHNIRGISMTDNWKPTAGGGAATGQSAVTVGAGERWKDVYNAVTAAGKIVAGGAEQTVGAAGGWLQGGGHGPFANKFGLGVDNLLEARVVLANGTIVVANAQSNADLFWALRGGGGSTFGIIVSATMKTYPFPVSAGYDLTISQGSTGFTGYLAAMTYWIGSMADFTDFGLTGYPTMTNSSYAGRFIGTGKTADQLSTFIAPYIAQVKTFGVDVTLTPGTLSDYLITQQPEPVGQNFAMGSRLITRAGLADKVTLQASLAVILATAPLSFPYPIAGGQVAANKNLDIAVNPAWRDAILHFIVVNAIPTQDPVTVPIAYGVVTNILVPVLDALSGSVGAYINEGNSYELNWQGVFWGNNYNKLKSIKSKYDPNNVLWCRPCVGSDALVESATDGKLYKA